MRVSWCAARVIARQRRDLGLPCLRPIRDDYFSHEIVISLSSVPSTAWLGLPQPRSSKAHAAGALALAVLGDVGQHFEGLHGVLPLRAAQLGCHLVGRTFAPSACRCLSDLCFDIATASTDYGGGYAQRDGRKIDY